MIPTSIRKAIGLIALVVLSACASNRATEQQAGTVDPCPPPNTLTCDRFAGENYNCKCERGSNLRDMLDAYHMQ